MATLQKFKLLATQCTVIGSPARSPTTSPVIHIRRRKTLRMLLGRGNSGGNGGAFNRRFHAPPPENQHKSSDEKRERETGKENNIGVRLKLKDLFVSSPPPPPAVRENEETQRLLPVSGRSGGGLAVARGSLRPLSATLRQRLLMRRAWRPVLVAIPEQSP